MRRAALALLTFLACAVALAFLVLPLAALLTHLPPDKLAHQFTNPVVTDALVVSLETSAIRPLCGRASPATAARIVDFPEPDGPTSATTPSTSRLSSRRNSRSGSAKLTERIATGCSF